MKFSIDPKINSLKPSPALSFNERVKVLLESGRKIYHFGFGESRLPISPVILKSLCSNATKISYEPVGGINQLKKAASQYWNRKFLTDFSPELTFIGTGSKILFHDVLRVLDGDLILSQPTWVSYEPQATMMGKKVIWADTYWRDNCCLTAVSLEKAVVGAIEKKLNPKILLIANPGNPTGTVYPEKTIEEIAIVCRKYSIVVISDEIYALINHKVVPHTCFAKYLPEATIVTNGLSKAFSLGGWRLGFAFLPNNELGRKVYEYMRIVAGSSWSVAASPVQYAAISALSFIPEVEEYLETSNRIHTLFTHYLYRKLKKIGIELLPPQGGFYLYLDFGVYAEKLSKLEIKSSDELANHLLEKYGVASLPGSAFGENKSTLTIRLATSYIYSQTDKHAAEVFIRFKNHPFDPLDVTKSDNFIFTNCPEIGQAVEKFDEFISIINQL